jgi:hypothetical protein
LIHDFSLPLLSAREGIKYLGAISPILKFD